MSVESGAPSDRRRAGPSLPAVQSADSADKSVSVEQKMTWQGALPPPEALQAFREAVPRLDEVIPANTRSRVSTGGQWRPGRAKPRVRCQGLEHRDAPHKPRHYRWRHLPRGSRAYPGCWNRCCQPTDHRGTGELEVPGGVKFRPPPSMPSATPRSRQLSNPTTPATATSRPGAPGCDGAPRPFPAASGTARSAGRDPRSWSQGANRFFAA